MYNSPSCYIISRNLRALCFRSNESTAVNKTKYKKHKSLHYNNVADDTNVTVHWRQLWNGLRQQPIWETRLSKQPLRLHLLRFSSALSLNFQMNSYLHCGRRRFYTPLCPNSISYWAIVSLAAGPHRARIVGC